MASLIRVLITVSVVAYLGICALLFFFQRSLVYYPQSRAGLPGATINLPTAKERVVATVRLKDGPRALLYFGGNAEDVSFSLPDLAAAFPDSALYLLHYRGYGGSTGKPSEQALFADVLALFDLVHAQHQRVRIVGRSLGSALAVYVASQRPVERLVLVTPFDSLQTVAAAHIPYVPVSWLLRDTFESWRYAPRVTAPTLILAAENDEIVPCASTDRLRAAFTNTTVSFRAIAAVGHNTISDRELYWKLLSE